MSKAFTKETNEEVEIEKPDLPYENVKNYVTPFGLSELQKEFRQLLETERPQIVETVRWAAGNGDRSENGDYIYGKKRLREIDRRLRYLTKRIETAIVVDPEQQKNLNKIFFGATVTYIQKNKTKHTIKIVGIDEADLAKEKISWISPIAKAMLKAEEGDIVRFETPNGIEEVEILTITY